MTSGIGEVGAVFEAFVFEPQDEVEFIESHSGLGIMILTSMLDSIAQLSSRE
jgi:hypothetical protein